MIRTASAQWKGTGLEGKGALTTQSGAFAEQPFSFKLRFQNEDGKQGTNPEELIAAAHAGCFAMALSFQLNAAGFTADELNVSAALTMEKEESGWVIKSSALKLKAIIPGIEQVKFVELTNNAKAGCPVSKVLNANITLEAELL